MFGHRFSVSASLWVGVGGWGGGWGLVAIMYVFQLPISDPEHAERRAALNSTQRLQLPGVEEYLQRQDSQRVSHYRPYMVTFVEFFLARQEPGGGGAGPPAPCPVTPMTVHTFLDEYLRKQRRRSGPFKGCHLGYESINQCLCALGTLQVRWR